MAGVEDRAEALGEDVARDLVGVGEERALSLRVCSVRVLIRVREASDEPGSLNPRWPSEPIPRIWRSIAARFGDGASYVGAGRRDVGGEAVRRVHGSRGEVDAGGELASMTLR